MNNLANLKSNVDKLDTDKLQTVSVNLSEVSSVVNNTLMKKQCMMIYLKKLTILIQMKKIFKSE